MKTYILELVQVFSENSNPNKAKQQEKYMKNRFVFYGLSSPERRKLQTPFLINKHLPNKEVAINIIKNLWQKPQRELHYFAMELAYKYLKKPNIKDIELYEYLLTHNSWWDTVDYIASNLVGNYFIEYRDQREEIIEKWMQSNNIWLQRTCLIFQLKYKESTDLRLLSNCIEQLIGTNEFFINKAIGWTLRQYGKTNPDWVIDFVAQHTHLANLSKREALRLL